MTKQEFIDRHNHMHDLHAHWYGHPGPNNGKTGTISDIGSADRKKKTFMRKWWYELDKHTRHRMCEGHARPPLPAVHYNINERAEAKFRFDTMQEDGVVARIRSGMDCDCTQYVEVQHIPVPKSLFAWQRSEWKHYDYLDGPENTYYAKPSEREEYSASHDLAAEAHENGHQHVVYPKTLH